MNKLTVTSDLGWCLARGVLSEAGEPAVTIVSPASSSDGFEPAASVIVYGRKGVEALGRACRYLVPEVPLHGLILNKKPGQDEEGDFELEFVTPDRVHATLAIPAGPLKDVVLAWWKGQVAVMAAKKP